MVQWFLNLVFLILTTVWEVEQAGVDGAAKKADAMKKIQAALSDKNVPISVPRWFPMGALEWLISKLIDIAVDKLQGFFGK